MRFDLNDYTVPHTHVRRTLSVLADEQQVRIFEGASELACHPRSFDRHQVIEDPQHLQALVEHKRRARAHRGCDALAAVAPASTALLQLAATRGYGLAGITAELLRLLDQYGAPALQLAMLEAVARDVPHPNAVRLVLEHARELAGRPPALPLALPEHVTRRDAPMPMQSLASYDRRYDHARDQAKNQPKNQPERTGKPENHPPKDSNDD